MILGWGGWYPAGIIRAGCRAADAAEAVPGVRRTPREFPGETAGRPVAWPSSAARSIARSTDEDPARKARVVGEELAQQSARRPAEHLDVRPTARAGSGDDVRLT